MAEPRKKVRAAPLLGYALIGVYFGVVLTITEAVSWFRIQEMFRFGSLHMYGLLGSAVATAALSLFVLRRVGARTPDGRAITFEDKRKTPTMVRYWAGGTIFGVGWALLGACPGPLYTLVGGGVTVYLLAIAAALLGTLCYGVLRERLPH